MRTLSARILLGFAALTVTFGVITATRFHDDRIVEREIRVLRLGYVRLEPLPKELQYRQKDLADYLDSNFEDDPHQLVDLRVTRDRAVTSFRTVLTAAKKNIPDINEHEFDDLQGRLDSIQTSIDKTTPYYARLNKFPGRNVRDASEDENDALAKLRESEHMIERDVTETVHALELRIDRSGTVLEENEHKLRLATIYFGLTAVVLGLLITTWVVITLRPLHQLREAARRVAAGDYGKRIDERGPTEVKDLARELNSMARAVEERERELVRSERLAAVGKMAAMITHEVRNPLSSIGLNTELLQEELAEGSDDAKQLCRSIHREVDRLTAITEEYLAFARLPKPKIAREPVNALAGQLAEFVREDLAAKQVRLQLDLATSDPIALIDAAQLRQCLINLVRNAADAVIAKGGGRVMLRTKKADTRVVIEVEDEGTGIPPDVQARMFDPFFSTKEGGSGLGLALTQQIVKDHGGDLAVNSTVGRGTTFTVSVPAA